MGAIGNCCCCGCNAGSSAPFRKLKFESLSGSHPVSFENDLWLGTGTANFNPIRANANNIKPPLCQESYLESLGVTRATTPKRIMDYIAAGNCCMWGVAVPESGECYSSNSPNFGRRYDYVYGGGHVLYEERRYIPYSLYAGTGCDWGTGVDWELGTWTYEMWYDMSISQSARRYLEGVTIEACYMMVGYELKLRLRALVSFHDWLDVRYAGRVPFRRKFSGAAAFPVLSQNPIGGCHASWYPSINHEAMPGTDWEWVCNPTNSGDATVPMAVRPSGVEGCFSTLPLLTSDGRQYRTDLNSPTNNSFYRDIYLDPNCTIAGTHVFPHPSSGTVPEFIAGAPECFLVANANCFWPWGTSACASSPWNPPVASNNIIGNLGFQRIVHDATQPYKISGGTPGTSLIDYWTEPWTITIS